MLKIQQDLVLLLALLMSGLILLQKDVSLCVLIDTMQMILQEKIYALQVVQEIFDIEIIQQLAVLIFVQKVTILLVIKMEIGVFIHVLVDISLK